MSQYNEAQLDVYEFINTVCSERKILNKTTVFETAYDIMVGRKELSPHGKATRNTKRNTFTAKFSKKELTDLDKHAIFEAVNKLLKEVSGLVGVIPNEILQVSLVKDSPKEISLTQSDVRIIQDSLLIREIAVRQGGGGLKTLNLQSVKSKFSEL